MTVLAPGTVQGPRIEAEESLPSPAGLLGSPVGGLPVGVLDLGSSI